MPVKVVPIKPTVKLADAAAVIKAVQQANADEGFDIVKDLNKTTETWKRRPKFKIKITTKRIDVFTDDDIWNMLDEGTRPHLILPKRGKMLRFQAGYSAKTRPGSLSSAGGGASGPVVWAQGVRHPGTVARRWTEKAQQESAKRYPARVQAKIDEVVK